MAYSSFAGGGGGVNQRGSRRRAREDDDDDDDEDNSGINGNDGMAVLVFLRSSLFACFTNGVWLWN